MHSTYFRYFILDNINFRNLNWRYSLPEHLVNFILDKNRIDTNKKNFINHAKKNSNFDLSIIGKTWIGKTLSPLLQKFSLRSINKFNRSLIYKPRRKALKRIFFKIFRIPFNNLSIEYPRIHTIFVFISYTKHTCACIYYIIYLFTFHDYTR